MSFPYHAIFAVIAAGFFLFRFWCQPKAYRLLLAVWAPATMMGYLVDETWWSFEPGRADCLFGGLPGAEISG